jgi:putative membrane protein insertion efficiency factor
MLIGGIRFYRLAFSPFMGWHCRFYPTCSHYAIEALEEHGVMKGALLTVKRLLRCQPFCKGGIDWVPSVNQDK